MTKRRSLFHWSRSLDAFLSQAGPLATRHITWIKAITRVVFQASPCIMFKIMIILRLVTPWFVRLTSHVFLSTDIGSLGLLYIPSWVPGVFVLHSYIIGLRGGAYDTILTFHSSIWKHISRTTSLPNDEPSRANQFSINTRLPSPWSGGWIFRQLSDSYRTDRYPPKKTFKVSNPHTKKYRKSPTLIKSVFPFL